MQEHEDYVALAHRADHAAMSATSRVAKTCWKALADEYRKLAAQQSPRPDKSANGAKDHD